MEKQKLQRVGRMKKVTFKESKQSIRSRFHFFKDGGSMDLVKEPTPKEMTENVTSLFRFFQENRMPYSVSFLAMIDSIEIMASYLLMHPDKYDAMLDFLKNEYRRSWKRN